jgi:hypothetical protein
LFMDTHGVELSSYIIDQRGCGLRFAKRESEEFLWAEQRWHAGLLPDMPSSFLL